MFTSGFLITIGVLVIELAAMYWLIKKSKQPPDPARPRLIPYTFLQVMLGIAILATLAHIFSLLTGEQLQPRRRRGL